MLTDFLLEIGCEELPFAAVTQSADTLAELVAAALKKAQLEYHSITPFAAPRRLGLLIKQLASEQPTQLLQRRGPAVNAAYDAAGKPSNALLGFAKSCNVAVEELKQFTTDKGAWMVHDVVTEGQKTPALLPQLIQQALSELPIAKPMRWGSGAIEFIRPVHWVVMLWGEETISCNLLGVTTGNCSYGHRFHAPEAVRIPHPNQYEALLEQAYVIASFTKRRELIRQQVQQLASQQQAQVLIPEELLDQVTAIVEWPQAQLAQFAPEFLQVPAEALIASMQVHQKCFALVDKQGTLLPHFITITNIVSTNPAQVIAGNEKVMRARLSDAAFFFQQDKKQHLASHVDATKNVVFQARLGSLYDKTERVAALMAYLTPLLTLDAAHAQRAAALSKCDLLTGMVGEFPELQGLMGYYYARHDGENEAVAVALNEQYLPRFAADSLPQTPLGLALSLADRLDTLVGIFAIGQKPSGVKDPFKLRRHALAVVRLLLSTTVPLTLSALLTEAQRIYPDALRNQEAVAELQPFILERLQSYYQSQSFPLDVINAVRARQQDWLYDFDKRLKALAAFTDKPEAQALSAACKRVNNILQQVSKEHGQLEVKKDLLENDAERVLWGRILELEQQLQTLYKQADYPAVLNQLASLRAPVDTFFDQVMVMVDDEALKQNRVALLIKLQALLQGVADISLLQNK